MAKKPSSRERFIGTAARLFMRQGYHATGLTQIVAESGAPKGSLYFHFPQGKEQLAAAAVEKAGSVFACQLNCILAKEPEPATAFSELCELLAFWMTQSDFREGCPISNACLELAPDNAQVASVCDAIFNGWRLAWENHLIAAGWQDQKARTTATTIMAALEGAFILARASRSTWPFTHIREGLADILKRPTC